MTWKLLEPLSHVHTHEPKINYLMGASALHLSLYKADAEIYLARSCKQSYPPAYLPYSALLLKLDRLHEAEKYLDLAVNSHQNPAEVDLLKSYLDNALISQEVPQAVLIESMGPNVNSDYSDHTPLVPIQDSILFFTSRRPLKSSSIKDLKDEFDENIYVSNRAEAGWTAATPVDGDVNGLLNDATVGLKADASEMLFFRTSRDLESSDLWTANFNKNKWKVGKKLASPINSKAIENSASMNIDGGVYYVSSDRPGGFGGFDIYRIVRFGNGDLSEPQNLGSAVNGPYDEISPFILPDERTLYFSSNGPSSIGGFDFFKSEHIRDTIWSQPVNLARPLCTTDDDMHISISWSGGLAYFSRPKADNLGDIDLFKANLPGFNVSANIVRIQLESYEGQEVEAAMFLPDFSETTGIYNVNENGEIIIVMFPGEMGILEIIGSETGAIERELEYQPHEGIWETSIEIDLNPDAE